MSSENRRLFLRLSPIVLPFTVIFAGGILFTILQSFGLLLPEFYSSGSHAFQGYRTLFSNTWFLRSLGYSMYVGMVSAILSVAMGTLLAYMLWRMPA